MRTDTDGKPWPIVAAEVVWVGSWDADTREPTFYAGLTRDEAIDAEEKTMRWDIKWDGCSHATFGDGDGYVHVCGGDSALALARMVCTVHREALATLKAAGCHVDDDEWLAVPAPLFLDVVEVHP